MWKWLIGGYIAFKVATRGELLGSKSAPMPSAQQPQGSTDAGYLDWVAKRTAFLTWSRGCEEIAKMGGSCSAWALPIPPETYNGQALPVVTTGQAGLTSNPMTGEVKHEIQDTADQTIKRIFDQVIY